MKLQPRILAHCALGLTLAASLAGCYIVPARPYAPYPAGYPAGYPAPQEVTVPDAPPPQQQEVYGVAPAVGWLWIGGYWGWNLGRHVWIGGHWEAPRVGHYWVPHRWAPVRGGWQLHHGHWARRQG